MTGTADSAGRPWEGRSFHHHETEFAGDDGSMDAGFEAAMRGLRAGTATLGDIVASLRTTRLLVPLLAEAGSLSEENGRVLEKSQELSIVSVEGPDGAPILPMFSNVAAMQAWNRRARPVPVGMDRAVTAALEDIAGRIVVDAGSWSEIVLTRPMLVALVTNEPFARVADDETVRPRLLEPLLAVDGVLGVVLTEGDPHSRLHGDELEAVVLVDATRRGQRLMPR